MTPHDCDEGYDPDRRLFQRRSVDQNAQWPQWLQTVLAIATTVVVVTLAYAALDKRISLVEQKLDYVVRQVSK